MPDGDTTNPRITLDDVPVMEPTCQKRRTEMEKCVKTETGKMLAAQEKTHKLVVEHKAFHKGLEKAGDQSRSTGQYIVRIIGLIIVAALAIGGTVWAVSEIARPSVDELAAAVAQAMEKKPLPKVEYDDTD